MTDPLANPSVIDKDRFDIRSKLSLLITMLIITFLFNHPLCHLMVLMVILMAGFSAGLTLRRVLSPLLPLLPMLLLILLFAGFRQPDHFVVAKNKLILWQGGEFLVLTVGGLKLGLTFLLRLVNMVTATGLLLFVTEIEDFIQLFHKMRLPRTVAFVLTTAIRFIPELEKKRSLIRDAQLARGADQENAPLWKRYYLNLSIMLPLIINAIIMADQLTMALLSRGFGYGDDWTTLQESRLGAKDVWIIGLCGVIAALCVLIRIKTAWGTL